MIEVKKFETRKDIKVMGFNTKTDMQNASKDCGDIWHKFDEYWEKGYFKTKNEYYGISHDYDEKTGKFSYMAAVTLEDDEKPYEEMETLNIPQAYYAVFEHVGDVKTMSQTFNKIFQEWLPNSEYTYDPKGKDFELYNEDFKPHQKESKVYIYLPVIKK
ncbi:MAG: AraC family transcriptional regulator [Oceanotoga sp.]|uniref:GyrI-like domain-containing protein n=1 Tax=Oceanotoga sp. TaxID=2108366 RepID=UPI00264F38A7|nr:GyrI-like domain-containing protein [Oceanotoga sp.]MDN5342635.1 AraC family transcriptional regulator [Oceanotoga sp.]